MSWRTGGATGTQTTKRPAPPKRTRGIGRAVELSGPLWGSVDTLRTMTFRSKVSAAASLARGRAAGLPGARVDPECKIRLRNGHVDVGAGVQVQRGAHLAVIGTPDAPARLTVGEGTLIGARSRINVTQSLTIGAHTEISWLVQIMDTDFHRITDLDGTVRAHQAPVVIGDHVLIGTGVIITKGVTIGDGAVVGAGSVVTRDVKAGELVAGNPARPVREIAGWV